jgi:phage I-like protein
MKKKKNILLAFDDAAAEESFFLQPMAFDDSALSAEGPLEFEIVRFGENQWTKGDERGHFAFNEADADNMIADFKGRGRDVVFDYEHQTLSGKEAPASGWIKELRKTDKGVVAKVDWTERAKKYFHDREYRYHSPVLHFQKGRPFRLHSAALTNRPAMHGYPALVANDKRQTHQKEEKMNEHLKKIAAMLGVEVIALADGKEDEKATATAVFAKLEEQGKAGKSLGDLLALHDVKSADELTLKIKGMIPAAEKTELEARLAGIEADKVVAKAFSDGKLVEAQRPWAVAYATQDLKAFSDFIDKAPKVAPGPASGVKTADPAKDGDGALALTDAEKEVYKNLNLSEEQIKKIKEEK